MDKRKDSIVIIASMFLLLSFGVILYSQYNRVPGVESFGKYYYLEKYLFCCFIGMVMATIAVLLKLRVNIKRRMICAYILIAVAIIVDLLPTELPFIITTSGGKYIDLFLLNLKASTINLILLQVAFLIIQQEISEKSKYMLFAMNGLAVLFVLIIAVDGNSENTLIAVLLFPVLLLWKNKKEIGLQAVNLILYGVVVGGYYIYILLQNIQNVSTWLNPYRDAQGKGYMKVQDFRIMMTSLVLGKSSYKNNYSFETLPTILILFGWVAFVIVLGLFVFMLINMFRQVYRTTHDFSGKLALSITIYFLLKFIFCIFVFFNLLPFYRGGHLPFIGKGSEIAVDIMLLGIYLGCLYRNDNIKESELIQ